MFHVQPASGEPLYLQLIRQIKHAIASGALAPGEQLPTVRQLAADLVINPNTVARAYRELEHDGLLEGVTGRGSFVTHRHHPRLGDEERRLRLQGFLDQLWAEGRALGYGSNELAGIVSEALRQRAEAERGA